MRSVLQDCRAFLADPRRRASDGVDFGVRRRHLAEPGLPWRVSWLAVIGELYAAEAFMAGWGNRPRKGSLGTNKRAHQHVEPKLVSDSKGF